MTQTVVIRTPEAIKQRIRERTPYDLFGFEITEYICCLSFEDAREFLRPEATAADWREPVTLDSVDRNAKEYLAFWLEKIEDERGLSVVRATAHFVAWKWLLGHPDSDTFPGAPGGPDGGYYQRTAYRYIADQISFGEWDRINKDAIFRAWTSREL